MVLINKTLDEATVRNFWDEMNHIINCFALHIGKSVQSIYMDCANKSLSTGNLNIKFTTIGDNLFSLHTEQYSKQYIYQFSDAI